MSESDGSLKIQGTAISSVAPADGKYRLVYQLEDGSVQQAGATSGPLAIGSSATAHSSPLVAIPWEGVDRIRVFGLNNAHEIIELYDSGDKRWAEVKVDGVAIKAAPSAGLAGFTAGLSEKRKAHLFFQDPVERRIRELIHQKGDDGWAYGDLDILDAIPDTSLAAAAVNNEDGEFEAAQVFYQDAKLTLKDYSWRHSGWKPGRFNPANSKVPSRTPIAAVSFWNGQLFQFQVYWHSRDGTIRFQQLNGKDWLVSQTTKIPASGYKFSVIEWSGLRKLNLYYQELDGTIIVHQSNDEGASWTRGSGLGN